VRLLLTILFYRLKLPFKGLLLLWWWWICEAH